MCRKGLNTVSIRRYGSFSLITYDIAMITLQKTPVERKDVIRLCANMLGSRVRELYDY